MFLVFSHGRPSFIVLFSLLLLLLLLYTQKSDRFIKVMDCNSILTYFEITHTEMK